METWDQAALEAYRRYLMCNIKKLSTEQKLFFVEKIGQETRYVGSAIYTEMFKKSRKTAGEKVMLVLSQLGGTIDPQGMLQLIGPYQLDPTLAPHGKFFQLFADTVRKAFYKKKLRNQEVHQLRMYIDRHNLTYIRKKYGGKTDTDEAALNLYAQIELGRKSLPKEPARFHNKFPKTSSYQVFVLGKENRKRVTPDFHAEFILDERGNFVSQWNVLKEREDKRIESDIQAYELTPEFEFQIMNGESFNYAKRNNQEHVRLDSWPPGKYDHNLRKAIHQKWRSPSVKQFNYQADHD